MTNIGPQFTPGPWRKKRCTLETDIGQRWCGRSLVMGPPCSDGRYCEEDASLISAAPDLYDALRMATDSLISLAPYPPEVAEAVMAIVAIARDALRKADGNAA